MAYKSQKDMNPAKIIGIQFSVLSPNEIRKGSVAEITSRDTYINNKPVIGGLFDPRMGVLEPGLICPTDGLDYMKTPGYFGHINLARPVYYIQYAHARICTVLNKADIEIDNPNLKLYIAGPIDEKNPTSLSKKYFKKLIKDKDIYYLGNIKKPGSRCILVCLPGAIGD